MRGQNPKGPVDTLNRGLKSLRLSVIDRCNFRCQYCMPEDIFGPDHAFLNKSQWLSFEEMERLVRVFTTLGVSRLRLTGGEPLLRPDLPSLVQRLIQIDGIRDLALTTNGSRLTRMSKDLFSAGLKRLTISLDSLDNHILKEMSGQKADVSQVIKGIHSALDAGFELKMNSVIMKGVNESQVVPLAEFCRDHRIHLRFIEFMDVGNSNDWDWSRVVSSSEIRESITSRFPISPVRPGFTGEVANRFEYADLQGVEIGFISSVSQPFCRSCNRARISSDGQLFTCLFSKSGFDLKSLLRKGIPDHELAHHISSIWTNRSDQYSALRTQSINTPQDSSKVEMGYIGG